jgi:hypothetical protein
MHWKAWVRKSLYPILQTFPIISLERLSNATKYYSHDSRVPRMTIETNSLQIEARNITGWANLLSFTDKVAV